MIFALTDIQFLWTQFGFAGLVLFASTYLATRLFQLWLKSKEADHQNTLDIQKHTYLRSLEQINKRDEIRFSDLHKRRAERIETLYVLLKEFFYSSSEFMPGMRSNPEKLEKANEALSGLVRFFDVNQIYFTRDHADGIWMFINGIKQIVTEKMIDSELAETDLAPEIGRKQLDRWNKLQEKFPKVLSDIQDEFRKLLGVEEVSH